MTGATTPALTYADAIDEWDPGYVAVDGTERPCRGGAALRVAVGPPQDLARRHRPGGRREPAALDTLEELPARVVLTFGFRPTAWVDPSDPAPPAGQHTHLLPALTTSITNDSWETT